jgi:SAM-dependent methyltransferase
MTKPHYPENFYERLTETSLPSAKRIVPFVLSLAPASSVVDVGCGNGSWLRAFLDAGVPEVLGVDGDWVAVEQLAIPAASFARRALHEPLALPRTFDLAVSLEVAEHLPPERADGFVADLVRAAPVVLFSAAIPGQGGKHHVNEQWPAWWAERFAAHGHVAIDVLRPRFWNDADVKWWYRQNAVLFANDDALRRFPALASARDAAPRELLPLVHPERFASAVRAGEPGFVKWLKMGRRAIQRSLRGRATRR